MHGKPSNLTAESYNEQIEQLVALKSALARLDCVETMDINHDENGRIRGRVSLRHGERFYNFNETIVDHPVKIVAVYSDDRTETTPDGTRREAVEVRVLIRET
ncbi:hypothetical protein [Natrinema pallidum]|uniref:Uncharacterized protein n=1 Tax=Natrinema pallidum TaxID=69527 RepID=A0A4P9TJV2_9EURY|nr:hypothetical protein [Natrinema pallidum]QCW05256.1 hypothetical protein FGF80_18590 [Natrinema pallidum]